MTTIMLIDDSPTIRKIVEVTLRREGYEVISFEDGITALRVIVAGELSPIPDLLLLDIGLPRMDGYEVARWLKAKPEWSQVTIVMLSRRCGVIDRLKARLAGASGYICKPCSTDQLIHIVRMYAGIPRKG